MVYLTHVGHTTKFELSTVTKYAITRMTDNHGDLQRQRLSSQAHIVCMSHVSSS